MEEIVIFHTNDLHSHLENWPKIRSYIMKERTMHETMWKTVLTIDLGDFIDRWHPLTEATNGQANIKLMNTLSYDAVTIGNNEGIGNSKKELNHLYDQANFDVVLGNVFDARTQQLPLWAQSYKVIETSHQTKIGLLGVTAPFPRSYTPNGWNVRTAKSVLPDLIQEIRQVCDVIVLISHLGIDEDIKIANEFPGIDVLLSSHSHHLFQDGEKINQTQLSAAGKFGHYIGKVQLTVDDGQLVSSQAMAISTADFIETFEDKLEQADYLEQGHLLLKQKKIANIPNQLSVDLDGRHSLMNLTTKAVKTRGKTEVAILNNGLFLIDMPKGIISKEELHQCLPHPMRLIRVTLSGKELVRMIKEMEKNRQYLRKFPMAGMGFRGKIFGELCYDGLTYNKETAEILWRDKEIEVEKNYTFTTVDHLLFVPFFPTIELAGEIEFLFPEFFRTVLADYLSEHYPIA